MSDQDIVARELGRLLIPPLARSPFVLPDTVRDRIAAVIISALTDAGRLVPEGHVAIERERWERVLDAASWQPNYLEPGDLDGSVEQVVIAEEVTRQLQPGDLDGDTILPDPRDSDFLYDVRRMIDSVYLYIAAPHDGNRSILIEATNAVRMRLEEKQ